MDRRQLLTAGVVAGIPVSANSSQANDGDDGIVGSWFGTVTATNPPLGQFNDLISFHTGGVAIESRRYLVPATPFGDLLETTGHGAWKRTGRNTFDVFFRFLLQTLTDGAPIGTDNIRLSLILDANVAGTLTGTFESQIKNPAGTVLVTVTGTYAATAITV